MNKKIRREHANARGGTIPQPAHTEPRTVARLGAREAYRHSHWRR